jgi:pimeloyl-ACP methyl ester carboxylesterase
LRIGWVFGLVAALVCCGGAHAATSCVRAEPACLQRLPLAPGLFGTMYATRPLTVRDPSVRRAVVMVHGTLRNADTYFTTATGAAFMAGALDDTLVIAPAFHSAAGGDCKDKLAPGEANWSCSGDSWRSGGASVSKAELTSFDFMDALVRRLADKKVFPNLTTVTIAGHSAGGQFVARYAMANRVHGRVPVRLAYVVANPSSYAWPDETRPLPTGDAAPAAAAEGWKSEDKPHGDFRYGRFEEAKAPGYNRWPYGLAERTGGYTKGVGADQLRAQLAARPVTYLLSQVDVLPLGGFDDSPQAMAQGPTRRARGEAYVKYFNEKYGGKGRIVIVPECGHNARCVFTTDEGRDVVFPPRR